MVLWRHIYYFVFLSIHSFGTRGSHWIWPDCGYSLNVFPFASLFPTRHRVSTTYLAQEDSELSLLQGERVLVHRPRPDGRLLVTQESTGHTGLFHSSILPTLERLSWLDCSIPTLFPFSDRHTAWMTEQLLHSEPGNGCNNSRWQSCVAPLNRWGLLSMATLKIYIYFCVCACLLHMNSDSCTNPPPPHHCLIPLYHTLFSASVRPCYC